MKEEIAGGRKIPDCAQSGSERLLVLHKQKRDSQERANSKFSGPQPKELRVRQNPTDHMEMKERNICFYNLSCKLAARIREIQKRYGRAPMRRE